MSLTPAEKYEYVKCLLKGKPLSMIAKEAGVSEPTLKGWRESCEKACLAALAVAEWADPCHGKNVETVALGRKIRLFRLLSGHIQASFALIVGGISRQDLVDHELGRRKPGDMTCRSIAEALSVRLGFLNGSIADASPGSVFLEKIMLFSLHSLAVKKTATNPFLDLLSLLLGSSEVKDVYTFGDDYMLVLGGTFVFLRCYGRGPAVAGLLKGLNRRVHKVDLGQGPQPNDEQTIKDFLRAYCSIKLINLDVDSLVADYVRYRDGHKNFLEKKKKSSTMKAVCALMDAHGITLEDIKRAMAEKTTKVKRTKQPSGGAADIDRPSPPPATPALPSVGSGLSGGGHRIANTGAGTGRRPPSRRGATGKGPAGTETRKR